MMEAAEIVILQEKVRSLEERVKNLEIGNIIKEQSKIQAGKNSNIGVIEKSITKK